MYAQDTTIIHSTINKKRLRQVIIGDVTLYSLSLTGMYHLWYKDYPQSSFHFFNDSHEWLMMDKVGHTFSAYYLSKLFFQQLKWTGLTNKKSTMFGGMIGWIGISSIEIFDGFSKEWGASIPDILANTTGIALFIGQQLLWNDQRVLIKYSFHPTNYSSYRPGVLGSNYIEKVCKDYNGQTYWLSFNVKSFIKKKVIPTWLNFSIGYGAEGMIGGYTNEVNNSAFPVPDSERRRQFYLSFDVDFSRIQTNSKILYSLLQLFNSIKFPCPAVEFSNKVKLHYVYF